MSTAVMWSKSKPDIAFQYGGRLGEFNGMSSQSHASHCRVLPLVNSLSRFQSHMPHCRVQSPSRDRATLQDVRIPSAILKIVFRHILLFLVFNAVWYLTSGGFRIVSDTLVYLPPTTEEVYVFTRTPAPAFVCLSVCLSVCVQDYSKTRAWIWMKFCVSTDVGTGTN